MACCIPSCKNSMKKKEPGISFHRFPTNSNQRRAWIDAVGKENWVPSKSSRICSTHFKESDFDKASNLKTFLKNEAIPFNLQRMGHSSKNVPELSEVLPIEHSSDLAVEQTQAVSASDDISKAAILEIENVSLKRKCERLSQEKNDIKKICKRQEAIIKKQEKKIQDLTSLIQGLKEKRYIDQFVIDRLNSVTAPNKEFLLRQLSTVTDITSPKNYSPDLRAFALTLNFYSPAAYDYVRETFKLCLPHPKTISRWYQHIDASPGFTTEALKLLRHVSEKTQYTIVCSLVMDEMAIRNHIEWDGHKHYGYVDVGIGMQEDNLPIAKNAFVFMVVSVNCSWKIPVRYFLIDGLNTSQRCNLIKQCLSLLHEARVKIVSLTYDGLSSNISAAKELGCDFNVSNMKTTFKHPVTDEDVAFILDPCHMLKLVRNTLGEKKTAANCNNNLISWEFITKLQDYQEKEGLKLANKLSKHHVNFHTQKMKVKLASQLLSSSVADAIEFCNKDLKLEEFKDSEATVEFIRHFNDVFDILNSRNQKQFGFKKPLNESNESEVIQRLNEIYSYISNLKVSKNGPLILDSPRKTGFLGFLICIKSMVYLYKTLVKSEVPLLKYLSMYKFSQDHLEMFFSVIRLHCGHNNNPTARQFRSGYRKLLVKSEIKHSKASNCIALEDITILNISCSTEPIHIINSSTDRNLLLDEIPENIPSNSDHDYVYCPGSLSEFSATAVEFIAGFVTRKLSNSLKCMYCITALTSNNSNCRISLIAKKTKGGLKYPSEDVYQICRRCEQVFRIAINSSKGTSNKNISMQALSIKVLKSFQHKNVFQSLDIHMHDTSPLENHTIQLIRAIANKYFNIRLFSYNKNFNLDKISVRQLYTKSVLFKGQ